ncbi:hypothetical protein ABK040_007181 [Willaertia magna]
MNQQLNHISTLEENVNACQYYSEILSNTFGPLGMDIYLKDNNDNYKITNDGATIIKYLPKNHPILELLSKSSLLQDSMIGDGTTSIILLINELLKRSIYLMKDKNISSNLIIKGFELATNICKEYILNYLSFKMSENDFYLNLIKTSMNSKIISNFKIFEFILMDIVKFYLNEIKSFKIVKPLKIFYFKKLKEVNQSHLFQGIIYNYKNINFFTNNSTQIFTNCKVLICKSDELQGNIISKKFKTNFTDKHQSSIYQIEMLKDLCDKLIKLNINIIFNIGLGFHSFVQEYFYKHNIICVGFVDFKNAEIISIVTNAKVVNSIYSLFSDNLLINNNISNTIDDSSVLVDKVDRKEEEEWFGFIGRLEICFEFNEIIINDCKVKDNFIWKSICICAPTESLCDEIETSLNDAISLLQHVIPLSFKSESNEDLIVNYKMVYGGCYIWFELIKYLNKYCKYNYDNSLQIVIENYANALEIIPTTLLNNCGLNVNDILSKVMTLPTIYEQINNEMIEYVYLNVLYPPYIHTIKRSKEEINNSDKENNEFIIVEPIHLINSLLDRLFGSTQQIIRIDKNIFIKK